MCLRVLRTMCHSKTILPTTFELARVQHAPGDSLAYGGFSETRWGTIREDFCVKQLRISTSNQEKVKQVLICPTFS